MDNLIVMKYLKIYLVIINFLSFILFFIDKKKAISDNWRIKERTLHLTSFLGGSLGSIIAMKIFHHKTKKLKFCIITGLALLFNILVLGGFFFGYGSLIKEIL